MLCLLLIILHSPASLGVFVHAIVYAEFSQIYEANFPLEYHRRMAYQLCGLTNQMPESPRKGAGRIWHAEALETNKHKQDTALDSHKYAVEKQHIGTTK